MNPISRLKCWFKMSNETSTPSVELAVNELILATDNLKRSIDSIREDVKKEESDIKNGRIYRYH